MGKLNDFVNNIRNKSFINTLMKDNNADIYLVGGVVRDLILNKPNKDIDLVVRKVSIDDLISILEKFGKVDVVGKSFGVIKFIDNDGIDYDIALPRKDKPTGEGGYHGFVIQSNENLPINVDLNRRDFRMNAMAINVNTGKFIDPLGGLEDIEKKQISAANSDAFSDDPLRMLRTISFASRFGFKIEPKTRDMIRENASRIKEIPAERILIEFDKIIKKGNPFEGAYLLKDLKLTPQIFNGDGSLYMGKEWQEVQTMGEFLWLLAHHLVQDIAEYCKTKLKCDIETYKELKAFQQAFQGGDKINNVTARTSAHNIYKISPKTLESRILPESIKHAAQELLSGKYPKDYNELAVNGNDLMDIGLQGKAIGDAKKRLLIQFYSANVRNGKEELLSLLKTKENEMQEGYPNYSEIKPQTWDVNGKQVDINFFVKKYDKWNHQGGTIGYREASKASVLEFLQNNYEDFSNDEKLKNQLYWALTDRDLLNEDDNGQIEYGALMLFLDVPVWKKITSVIKKDDIYEKDGEFGIETEPHVTILYGFHDSVTADEVFDLYKENFDLKPIEIGIEGISTFENQDFDVVKMDVESEILSKMNSVMRKLPNTTKYPKYHAHITLAYVKKGCGKNYVKKFEKNRMMVGDELVFSIKKEKQKKLKLTEKGLLKEEVKKVNYSAVVLDDKSRAKLIKVFKPMIPEGFEIIAHHMTIKMGALETGSREKQDMENGTEITLNVVDYAMDNLVMAVGVEGYPTTNAKPHITIAVNRAEGGKPFLSNKLNDWKPLGFPLTLTGKVNEI